MMPAVEEARARTAGAVVLEVRRLCKTFGATRALNNVSLTIKAGEVHCLLGENGAGKSTLAKIIGGLIQPDTGELEMGGRAIRFRSTADARAQGIGMVFQELSLAPDLSVRENICLGTEAGVLPFRLNRTRREKALCRSLLAEFGLDFDLESRVRDLPVASQQLLEVAKAMMSRPRILLLDEPTAMLGVHEKRKLLDMVHRAKSDRTAIVFVTHHIEDVLEVADQVSLMRNGALVESFAANTGLSVSMLIEKLSGRQEVNLTSARSERCGDEVLAIHALAGTGDRSRDITIRAGEIIGLYGVVGCGIDGIRDMIVGTKSHRKAPLMLDGRRYVSNGAAAAARRGISYLPSGRAANGIFPTLSIRENLTLAQPGIFGRFFLTPIQRERAKAKRQLERLRTRFASQEDTITALSGGNQQKVLIGRCIERGSKLLLLEDPTAGVDINAKKDIHDLIRARAAAGQAILLLSSDLQETIALCNAIYTVHDGRIVDSYRNPSFADEPRIIVDILGAALPSSEESRKEQRDV
jgi:ribose transport system ATP-binding protein